MADATAGVARLPGRRKPRRWRRWRSRGYWKTAVCHGAEKFLPWPASRTAFLNGCSRYRRKGGRSGFIPCARWGSVTSVINNALRILRRMLKKAQEWQLLSTVPIVKLVEEQGREELIEPWMEQRLLTVTAGPRLTGKGRKSRVGWEPFRTVLLIMLDSGLRPGEIFRMRWENIHWDKGLIFNPRGKSRKSRRYVPLTERVNVALQDRKEGVNEGWIFPSKRARSGYITDREVSKQWLEAKRLAGVPESVVLYCARHRFSTDAMEGTGNLMAVMDAMGHGSVNTTRIYTHSNVQQIREAIERRNQLSTKPVEAVQKLATKVATVA
ncbi:MAG: hypothetical protein DMG93_22240 [Acidobacteria bacterium]|nr:MAG: hypothetical protein DMG93_22240 [Acidobacteriota bacterium]